MKQEEWQKGNDSKLTSLQRLELHNIWLKTMHEEIKNQIIIKNNPDPSNEEIVGFLDL